MKAIACLSVSALTSLALSAADFESTLQAMKESQIVEPIRNEAIVSYRFTCIPTFNHPFSIKVFKTQQGFILIRKVLSGKGGWEPGVLAEKETLEVSDEAIAELYKMLRDLKFSELESESKKSKLDGTDLILEVVKDGSYRKVEWFSTDADYPLNKLGRWFLRTAQWQPGKPK